MGLTLDFSYPSPLDRERIHFQILRDGHLVVYDSGFWREGEALALLRWLKGSEVSALCIRGLRFEKSNTGITVVDRSSNYYNLNWSEVTEAIADIEFLLAEL